MEHQISIQDLLCGRTFPEPSAATRGETSKPSCKPSVMSAKKGELLFLSLKKEDGNLLGASWGTVGALPGVSMTLNFGEYPSEERESTLSQILDLNAPEKYSLSPTACAGIIRRAEKRGKELPSMLKEALMEVIGRAGGMEKISEEPEEEAEEYGVGKEVAPTLRPSIEADIVYAIDHVITTGGNCTAQGPCVYKDICPTEKASGVHAVCFQNTGHGWWNQEEIAQTLRTPCGGDSMKANLVLTDCGDPDG